MENARRTVTLEGKTLKGKNRIREAGTSEWLVLRFSQCVLFSAEPGPWAFVMPEGRHGMARWVNLRGFDQHFNVTEGSQAGW